MKLYLLYLAIIPIFIVGCAVEKQSFLPDMEPTENQRVEQACGTVFPRGNWQFVHSIDFTMKNGSGGTVVGVTTLSENGIECALITVEGLTLFDAAFRAGKSFHVRRAVPPFDNPDFARGLIGDIRAIFQPPLNRSVRVGQLADASPTCRYVDTNRVVDVLPDVEGCWQIKSYTPDLIMNRSIIGKSCRKKGTSLIPDYLELKSYGHSGYTLKMTLISADNIK